MFLRTKNKRLDIPQSIGRIFEERKADGQLSAQLFVFYRQFVRDRIQYELPFERVPWKTTYNKNKARFENLAKLFNSNGIQLEGYIGFLVFGLKKTESDLKDCLLNMKSILDYIESLKNTKKLENIARWFINTSKFIADKCIECNISTSVEFLQKAIHDHKLGQYCLSGKISKYYLAGIPNFDKIISKLDYFSRCELKPLEDAYDVYKMDLANAFQMKGFKQVNPLVFTNKLIEKKKFKILSEKIPQCGSI